MLRGRSAARGLSLRLAGRRSEPLAALAEELAGTGVPVECVALDVTDAAAVRAAVGQVRVVVTTVGPFARYAPPVLDACLDIGVCYVDIANELTAIRGVLARDERAKELGVTVVTGAGFGPPAPSHSCWDWSRSWARRRIWSGWRRRRRAAT